MEKYCEQCGAKINVCEGFYHSDWNYLCCDCGDSYLCETDYGYVHQDDYKEFYLDDEMSDIEFYNYTMLLYEEEEEEDYD